MDNGSYSVYILTDIDGTEIKQKIGSFYVASDAIVKIEGKTINELLKIGSVTGDNSYRIRHTLNNGLYSVKKD